MSLCKCASWHNPCLMRARPFTFARRYLWHFDATYRSGSELASTGCRQCPVNLSLQCITSYPWYDLHAQTSRPWIYLCVPRRDSDRHFSEQEYTLNRHESKLTDAGSCAHNHTPSSSLTNIVNFVKPTVPSLRGNAQFLVRNNRLAPFQ